MVSIGMNVPVVVAASLGFGRDMWGIPADNITESLKWLYVAYFMYMFCRSTVPDVDPRLLLAHRGRAASTPNRVGSLGQDQLLRRCQCVRDGLPMYTNSFLLGWMEE